MILRRVLSLLERLWVEPRAPEPPGLGPIDAALVLLFLAALSLEVLTRAELHLFSSGVLLAATLPAPLLLRRRHPLLALLLAFGGTTILEWILAARGHRLSIPDAMAFVLVLPYALVRWGAGREITAGAPLLIAAVLVGLLRGATPVGEAIGGFAVVTAALALGAAARFRDRSTRQALIEVRLLERERLARDLHDTVAHHLAAIGIQARAGLAVAAQDPTATEQALQVIVKEASASLEQLRDLVQVLRAEPTPTAPLGLGALHDLTTPQPAGPRVEVLLPEGLDPVGPQQASTLYRVAQEAITNARRHAKDATRIRVEVRADEAWLTLEVEDDGAPSVAPSSPKGYGLKGMEERTRLIGGRCVAGPKDDRGWVVTATIPRRATP